MKSPGQLGVMRKTTLLSQAEHSTAQLTAHQQSQSINPLAKKYQVESESPFSLIFIELKFLSFSSEINRIAYDETQVKITKQHAYATTVTIFPSVRQRVLDIPTVIL